MIITSSVDTTCCLWDIEVRLPLCPLAACVVHRALHHHAPRLSLLQTQQAVTQLIAHDKEVLDVAFSTGRDVFGTVGADGSFRTFDLRCVPLCCSLQALWHVHAFVFVWVNAGGGGCGLRCAVPGRCVRPASPLTIRRFEREALLPLLSLCGLPYRSSSQLA